MNKCTKFHGLKNIVGSSFTIQFCYIILIGIKMMFQYIVDVAEYGYFIFPTAVSTTRQHTIRLIVIVVSL